MAAEFRRDRLRALSAPLFMAIRLSQEFNIVLRIPVQSPPNSAANEDTASREEEKGILTPWSQAKDWRSRVVEVGSIFGIPERKQPEEIMREFAARFGLADAPLEKEALLSSIAERLGLGESRGKPYISLLESIGANLGVQTEPFFDQNLYYMKAEQYWTESIARKLGIPTLKNEEEILLGVGERLGIEFGPDEKEDAAILRRIALRLGLPPAEDSATMLRLVESAVRGRPFAR